MISVMELPFQIDVVVDGRALTQETYRFENDR
jgi:hypothetical protein